MSRDNDWRPGTDETDDIEVGRVALRTFKVDYRTKELRSITQPGSHWKGGVCTAICLAKKSLQHTTPSIYCVCGIYGTLTLDALRQFGPLCIRDIVTVIAAEGITIIGPTGLRTERARVIAYWSPARGIRKLAAKQFEGARHFDDLQALLDEYDLPAGGPLPTPRWLDHGIIATVLCPLWSLFALQDAVIADQYIRAQNYGWAAYEIVIALVMATFALHNFRLLRQRFGF